MQAYSPMRTEGNHSLHRGDARPARSSAYMRRQAAPHRRRGPGQNSPVFRRRRYRHSGRKWASCSRRTGMPSAPPARSRPACAGPSVVADKHGVFAAVCAKERPRPGGYVRIRAFFSLDQQLVRLKAAPGVMNVD